jgi:thioredoxin-related protein
MKNRFLLKFTFILIFITLIFITTKDIFSQNSSINWVEYDKALNDSKQNKKHVFLYFWTESCPYCQKMKNITLTNKEVIEYLNNYFNSVSIDANSSKTVSQILNKTGNSLANFYMIQGVPTSIFLKTNGETLYNIPGFIEWPTFLLILKYIATNSYEKMSFNEFKKNNQ